MAQYQSFPDAPGDSRTLDKLKALKLPDIRGRDFLDVGCNEGFFCGFAEFLGARRSVGVDHSQLFVERARQRFPGCEFHRDDWNHLPEGPFDVILVASALHYADDQPALLHRLVELLGPDGVLVLELGIFSAPESAWIEVERGIDRRMFPTMAKLQEVLEGYAWKWMGQSVSQDGDPVPRHVVHVSRRRPIAYLLMQPPAFGKSSIAKQLFQPAGTPVISGDQQIALAAQGKVPVPEALRKLLVDQYSPFRIDETIRKVFAADGADALVRLWARDAGGGDFALDGYVPTEYQPQVKAVLIELGYLPVELQWDRVGPRLLPSEMADARAEEFYLSMAAPGTRIPEPVAPGKPLARGFVDQVSIEQGRLAVRGWVVDANGRLPDSIGLRLPGRDVVIEAFERQRRPDVQAHLKLPHDEVGYRLMVDLGGVEDLAGLGPTFGAYAPDLGEIQLAAKVRERLKTAREAKGRPDSGQAR